jgi:signal transduction histidine kinase
MLERLRQSLALRLAIQYALVFALGAALLFGVLYWLLANAFDARERAALVQQTKDLVAAFERGGIPALSARANNSPNANSFFVRLIRPEGETVFQKLPPDWVETQIEQIPLGAFTLTVTREIPILRSPQNALRDYTIATQRWSNDWQLQVGRLLDSRAVLLSPLRRAFAAAGAAALLLSVGVGTLLAWRATRPLRAVSDTTRRIIATGDLSARVPGPEGSGELAVLVRQLNTLLEKNATHVRVLRDTLDNLAHDLRTPLTRLRGTAELAMQDAGDPMEARAALADCVNESDRVLHLLETLLDISAAEAGALKLNRDVIDVRTLTERAADLYREVAEEKKITIALEQPQPVELAADAIRLGQAINNLVDNALKYTPAGGNVVIATHPEARAVVIRVSDNGPGVPTAEKDAIFRRLYRGDASRSQRGLGLGLSLVKAIVEAHGGTVNVEDVPGGGAMFVIRIPRQAI